VVVRRDDIELDPLEDQICLCSCVNERSHDIERKVCPTCHRKQLGLKLAILGLLPSLSDVHEKNV
jgi:hypothetical protein